MAVHVLNSSDIACRGLPKGWVRIDGGQQLALVGEGVQQVFRNGPCIVDTSGG